MVRSILNWCDKQSGKGADDLNHARGIARTFVSYGVECLVDGAFYCGLFLIGGCAVIDINNRLNK